MNETSLMAKGYKCHPSFLILVCGVVWCGEEQRDQIQGAKMMLEMKKICTNEKKIALQASLNLFYDGVLLYNT